MRAISAQAPRAPRRMTVLRHLNARFQSEEFAFALIELLVVMVVIGILAAIALPHFLSERAKAQDSSAKSDARNVVSQLEACYGDATTYKGSKSSGTSASTCLPANTGLPIGTAPGEVNVTSATAASYKVVAKSKSNDTFTITKNAKTGVTTRTCTGSSGGGCTKKRW